MADDWERGLPEWGAEAAADARAVFLGTVAEVHRSIKTGSELTGAPGQPVKSGNLRGSIQTVFEAPDVVEIATNVVYAPGIEDGVSMKTGQPLTLRSPTGGFHSFKQTEAQLDRVIEHVARQVLGGA